ncbi:fluoride efflux transporter CrcB [bacterium]|nr:MAG: fluoride efflux transporter CrcB [bacterium]
MMNLIWVGIGGALGAISRYKLTEWINSLTPGLFPFGTLTVNVLGSFILGFIIGMVHQGNLQEPMRLAIATGFLGALTTFSTFSMETIELFKGGLAMQGFINIGMNVVFSLLASASAYWLSTQVFAK